MGQTEFEAIQASSHQWFEYSIYVLAVACLLHALRRDRSATGPSRWRATLTLLGGIAFGMILEVLKATPRALGTPENGNTAAFQCGPKSPLFAKLIGAGDRLAYCYTVDYFHLVYNHAVPICIAVAWGVLIYAAMNTTRRLSHIPLHCHPFLNAILALIVDVIVDPVASDLQGDKLNQCAITCAVSGASNPVTGLGMWHWVNATRYNLYGVPLANFFGWFLVMFTFTYFHYLFFYRIKPGRLIERHPLLGNSLRILGVILSALVTALILIKIYVAIYKENAFWEVGLLAAAVLPGVYIFWRYGARKPVLGYPTLKQHRQHGELWKYLIQVFNIKPDFGIKLVHIFFLAYFTWWMFRIKLYVPFPQFLLTSILALAVGLFIWNPVTEDVSAEPPRSSSTETD